MRCSRRRFSSDDVGQMMLLGAVVLILGFVALAGLVARVNQLPASITRDQASPIFLEVEPLNELVDSLLAPTGIAARLDPADPAYVSQYRTQVEAALANIRELEAGKGIFYDGVILCSAGTGRVESTLWDGQVMMVLVSERTFTC